MSDEEDYMSDAFLQQIPDTRPGLVPKHKARNYQQQKKEKIANEKNKQKPKAVIEKEKRDAGLGSAISSDNKGFSMMQKMGYKPGTAIGKSGVGRMEPVPVEVKLGRGGLGRESDMKRKKEKRTEIFRNMTIKRQQMEVQNKQNFMQRMNEKVARKTIEKDLYKSQKVCEQLDSQLGIKEPHETFFWPEALLPGNEEEDSSQEDPLDRLQDDTRESIQDEPLDRLQDGYSRYVEDDDCDEVDDDDEEETEEEAKPSVNYTTEERLDVLTLYLRTKHKYCIWCGIKYEDKEDLNTNCPGSTAELHDD